MNICPVKRQSTLESAIEAIRGYIIDNDLAEGTILPTEMCLSEKLGISRNILREAMQHYRTLGIIESKPRVGATITRLLPENPYEKYQPFLAAYKGKIGPELAEARFILEPGAAPFMIANITAGEIDELKQISEKIKVAKDYETMRNWDTQFHSKLMRTTHNSILIGMIPLLVDFFNQLLADPRISLEEKELNRIHSEHLVIVEALSKRDAEKLRTILENHTKNYLNHQY